MPRSYSYKQYRKLAAAEKRLPKGGGFWTRSLTLALAQQSCTHCYGLGQRPGRADQLAPCNCVFRAIFRVCYARFRHCADKSKYISRISMESAGGPRKRKGTWGMKNEEYIADFCLVSRRALDDAEYRLFKFHFLLGADSTLCCPRLGIDRGTFFHEVYRIEQKLGRRFAELEPYALFPLDEYFGGTVAGRTRKSVPTREKQSAAPVKAPLKTTACALRAAC